MTELIGTTPAQLEGHVNEWFGMKPERLDGFFVEVRGHWEDIVPTVAHAAQVALVRAMEERMALEASDLIIAGAYLGEMKKTLEME